MKEWKSIDLFDGFYECSTDGEIRNAKSKRLLKPFIINSGYLMVRLRNHKGYLVHRLIAETFIPNPSNKPCVDHINTDRTNNSVCNLRWVTYSENNYNPLTNSKMKHKVYKKDSEGNILEIFDCAQDAADSIGVTRSYILVALSRKRPIKGFFYTY